MIRLTRAAAAVTLAACVAAGVHLAAQTPPELVNATVPGESGTATVPIGVCSVRIQAAGGSGGDGFGIGDGPGGAGAAITASVPVTPGSSIAYLVGGAGSDGALGVAGDGGSGGGGDGSTDGGTFSGGGGGGASAVALDGAPVVVSGGGGGGGGISGATGGQAGAANSSGANATGLDDELALGGSAVGNGGSGGLYREIVRYGGGAGGGVNAGGTVALDSPAGIGGNGDGVRGGGGGGGNLPGSDGEDGLGAPDGTGGAGSMGGFARAGDGGNGSLGIGGGGGGGGFGSGGGGAGYGGGGGGGKFGAGGGGSSFVIDGADGITSDTNGGDGFVIITYDEAADACTRPAFAQAFAPAAIRDGETSTLTFTIDGSGTTVDAMNVAFTNTLPAGLAIAPTPNASSTCGGTLTATGGTDTIALTGGTLDDGASCTVSVDVTASSPGSLVSTSGDLTSTLGNSGTSTATLNVTAAPVTSESVNAATGTGTIDVAISGVGCSITSASGLTAEDAAAAPPDRVELPHGLVDLAIEGCSPGGTVTIAVTYPETLPADTTFWKYGPTSGDASPHWYEITPSSVSGATVTYTITDGGLGDDDLTANGTIEDPAGVAVPATAVPSMPVVLLAVLATLVLGIGAASLERGRPTNY